MNHSTWKMVRIASLILLFALLTMVEIQAQCPMCRMSAEANLKDGGTAAAGLNKGIIYLLTIPYILIGTIGYFWWRNRKMVQEQEQEDEIRSLLEPHEVVISESKAFSEQ